MSNGFTITRAAVFTVVEHLRNQAHDLVLEVTNFVETIETTALKVVGKVTGTAITAVADFADGAIDFAFGVVTVALTAVLGNDEPS